VLAWAAAVCAIAGIGWAFVDVLRQRTGGPRFELFQAGVVAMLLVGAASGLIALSSGARPREGLHLLYAVIAVALVPLARSFLGQARGRGASMLMLTTFAVIGALVYRLITTG
jgi:cation transport ATPase